MKNYFALTLVAASFLIGSCNNSESSKDAAMKPGITEKSFGTFENQPVTEYTITNVAGMQVSIINYGGTLTKIITPDKNKKMGDVILGYDSLGGYLQKGNPYFGCLVGRYGNRIGKGKFSLNGQTYQLTLNNNGNMLHGGIRGLDKVLWTVAKLPGDSTIQLHYLSKDGDQGFPGNLDITVEYSLLSDNSLQIKYAATTDKPTPVNLTNHAYFNLSAGNEKDILKHEVMIQADQFTDVDTLLIPTGKLPNVKGTPMDFNTAKAVGKEIDSVKGGYDHNWVLNRKGKGLELVATVHEPSSGRLLEVLTTEPGLQFYTGNFLDGTLTGTKNNAMYGKHAALCLETQHFPDSPNQPTFPSTILMPGQTYSQLTVYRFSVK